MAIYGISIKKKNYFEKKKEANIWLLDGQTIFPRLSTDSSYEEPSSLPPSWRVELIKILLNDRRLLVLIWTGNVPSGPPGSPVQAYTTQTITHRKFTALAILVINTDSIKKSYN